MAEEHIKRSGAILAIQKYGVGSFDFEEDGWTPEQAERFVISVLKKLPAEDVAPVKHGEKIPDVEYEVHCEWFKCSVCGDTWLTEHSNFCPNCGARMDGE